MLPHGTRQQIAIAGSITLIVTLLRLIGEVQGWSDHLFSREPGGGYGLIGISWLVLPFGWVFGRHLVRAGEAPASRVAAVVWPLLTIALAVGLLSLLQHFLPQPTLESFLIASAIGPVCATIAYRGWPALWRTNLWYGIAARIPVMIITPIAVLNHWGTHYEKLAPGSPDLAVGARILVLCIAQVVFWLPFTVLLGGLIGGIAALVTRREAWRKERAQWRRRDLSGQ